MVLRGTQGGEASGHETVGRGKRGHELGPLLRDAEPCSRDARLETALIHETLIVEQHKDHLVVRLNRPERRNAINRLMVDDLHAVLAHLEREPRLLVLTGGDGGLFAAGADIDELRQRGRDEALAGINLHLFERIRRLPMPTIAAVDGPALGGGAELAYACDIRVASPRATFGQPEVGLGILAGAGGCFRLAELVGESLAKELLFTGRVLSAAEALDARLVSRVAPVDRLFEVVDELRIAISRNSSTAIRLTKLVMDAPRAAHPQLDLVAQALLFEGADKAARMDAFLERRGVRTPPTPDGQRDG